MRSIDYSAGKAGFSGRAKTGAGIDFASGKAGQQKLRTDNLASEPQKHGHAAQEGRHKIHVGRPHRTQGAINNLTDFRICHDLYPVCVKK